MFVIAMFEGLQKCCQDGVLMEKHKIEKDNESHKEKAELQMSVDFICISA